MKNAKSFPNIVRNKKTIVSIYLAMLSKIVVGARKPVEWKRLLEKCLFHGEREGVGKKWLCNKKEERKKRKKVRREIEFPSSFTPPQLISPLKGWEGRKKFNNRTKNLDANDNNNNTC